MPPPKTRNQPKQPRCPICAKPATEEFRPFCSKRCADVDLGRWLGGHYAIPGDPAPPEGSAGDSD